MVKYYFYCKILCFVVKHSVLWYNVTFLWYNVTFCSAFEVYLWYICDIFVVFFAMGREGGERGERKRREMGKEKGRGRGMERDGEGDGEGGRGRVRGRREGEARERDLLTSVSNDIRQKRGGGTM